MIIQDVTALRQRFIETVKAANPNLVVIFDNQPNVTPPTNKVWCRFTVKPSDKDRVQLGVTKKYQQIGIATLQIIVPAQMGDAVGYTLVDQMDAAFKEWRSTDKAMVVDKTSCQVFNPSASEPNFIINFIIHWRSIRT